MTPSEREFLIKKVAENIVQDALMEKTAGTLSTGLKNFGKAVLGTNVRTADKGISSLSEDLLKRRQLMKTQTKTKGLLFKKQVPKFTDKDIDRILKPDTDKLEKLRAYRTEQAKRTKGARLLTGGTLATAGVIGNSVKKHNENKQQPYLQY